jgi:hypothetical protein
MITKFNLLSNTPEEILNYEESKFYNEKLIYKRKN